MHQPRKERLSRGAGILTLPAMDMLQTLARRAWGRLLRLEGAWVAAHTRAQLRALSDRTLEDIGLTRAQIDSLYR